MDRPLGTALDLNDATKCMTTSLKLLRQRYAHGDKPGIGGWYHQLDVPIPGPTATAVGLTIFHQCKESFDHTNECLAFLTSRQVKSENAKFNGGWATNTSMGQPVLEASAWVSRSIGITRTTLAPDAPDALSAYHWITANQNPDGGWGSLHECPSRVWLTCLAIRALIQLNSRDGAIERGIEWLMSHKARDVEAWGELGGGPATVNHTAFALLTIIEACPKRYDDQLLRSFDWLSESFDPATIHDQNTRVESYNVTTEIDGVRATWQTTLPQYALPVTLSALLRHPVEPPCEKINRGYRTLLNMQLPNGTWPNAQGGISESIWAIAPFVQSLHDLCDQSFARDRDQLFLSSPVVVIQRASVHDQPLASLIRAQRRAALSRLVERYWATSLLVLSTITGMILVGAGRFEWKDFVLGLIVPMALFVIQEIRHR